MTRTGGTMRDAVEEAARAWELRLRLGADEATARDFETWRRADPRHADAYEEVTAAIETARTALGPALLHAKAHPPGAARSQRQPLGFATAAMFALVAIGAGYFAWTDFDGRYVTSGGEMRTVTLEDGSTIYMNGATRLRVAYGDTERAIRLEDGEALFEVAHNPSRPFRVTAGQQTVEAVGTAFDVATGRGGVDVAVREGVVKLQPVAAPTAAPPLLLGRGEAVLVQGAATRGAVRQVAPEQIGSWRQGELIFQSVAFARVLEALNRRYDGLLVVEDAALARTPVSIALNPRDRDSAVRLLEKAVSARAVAKGGGTILFAPSNSR